MRVDATTFAELISEYKPALLRYVVRLTFGDRHLAEDIVQETLLRLWRQPSVLDADRPVRPWLFTVARNLVCDARRARAARPQEVADVDLSGLASTDDSYDRVVESASMSKVLAVLTPEHRDILVQIYYLDRTLADTAAALDIPVGTVKSRLHYAQRALRLAIGERPATMPSTTSESRTLALVA